MMSTRNLRILSFSGEDADNIISALQALAYTDESTIRGILRIDREKWRDLVEWARDILQSEDTE